MDTDHPHLGYRVLYERGRDCLMRETEYLMSLMGRQRSLHEGGRVSQEGGRVPHKGECVPHDRGMEYFMREL